MLVKITSPSITGHCTGLGTVIEATDGQPLHGVSRAVITIDPREIIRAELEIACQSVEIHQAKASFWLAHPVTGDRREVKRIEFADGSVWEDTARG